MGKTKVLLDTNILISALGWKGKPRVIFEKCLHEELELITSSEQIDELQRAMDYPKFKFTEEQKIAFVSIILEIATMVEITGEIDIIKEDTNDNFILETAIVGKGDYIISGDDHLLKLKQFKDVKIVTSSEFLGI